MGGGEGGASAVGAKIDVDHCNQISMPKRTNRHRDEQGLNLIRNRLHLNQLVAAFEQALGSILTGQGPHLVIVRNHIGNRIPQI